MKNLVIECDGCQKDMSKEKYYHKLNLKFQTFMNDKNTGMEECMNNMTRASDNIYCDSCFNIFVKHIENFTQEIGLYIVDKKFDHSKVIENYKKEEELILKENNTNIKEDE